jgi:hypothetical protein
MLVPTSFFADYGFHCHVRVLEDVSVLQRLGHRVTIVTYTDGNPVPGLGTPCTLPIAWRRDYEVGKAGIRLPLMPCLGQRRCVITSAQHTETWPVYHALQRLRKPGHFGKTIQGADLNGIVLL